MLNTKTGAAFVNRAAVNIPISDYALRDLSLAVKDLFHIQGLPTSAGNPSWLASHDIPEHTNSSVLKLLQGGIKYTGKTLTDELAYSLNGQNVHYPSLVNPITPERIAGGSSSGSAVAVSSRQADIGLGTDTGGSIRVPASYNGLFGIRTSHGAIECDNMVPLAPAFDTIGWMTRSLEHLQRIAKVLLPTQGVKNQTTLRLCVLNKLVESAEHSSAINTWLQKLSDVHIQVNAFDAQAFNTSETFRVLQGHQIWQQHHAWINQQKPVFAPDIQDRFTWCASLTNEQVEIAKQQQVRINKHINTLFEDCDLLVIPTTPGRAPLIDTPASELATYREDLMSLTAIAGLGGLPQVHLPLFKIQGAPCGVSLIGKKNTDHELITMAKRLIHENEYALPPAK
jgi:amidase